MSPLEQRFWSNVDKSGECWIWIPSKDPSKYGSFGVSDIGEREQLGITGPTAVAHRAAYIFDVGPIPPGLLVCHECDTPACVRPAHLFTGTHGDNHRDKVEKGRHRYGKHWKPPVIDPLTIGGRLYAARRKERYTQAQAATAIGVFQTRISAWERGEGEPKATGD